MRGLTIITHWLGLAAATLAVLVLLADSQARAPARRPNNSNPNNSNRGMAFARPGFRGRPGFRRPPAAMLAQQEIAALRNAHQLLAQAKHDYDGHRVQAMHEITQAIHAMSPNQGKTANGKPGTNGSNDKAKGKTAAKGAGSQTPNTSAGGGGAAGKENQAQSDALLKQARQILQTVHGRMGTQHAKAKGYVQAAIQRLNTALKIN